MSHQRPLQTMANAERAFIAYETASTLENHAMISSKTIADLEGVIRNGEVKHIIRAASEMVKIVNRVQESVNAMKTPVYANHIANAKKEASAVKALVAATSALAAAEREWVDATEYLSVTEKIALKEAIIFAKEAEKASEKNTNIGSVEFLKEIAIDAVADAHAYVSAKQRDIVIAAKAVADAAKVIVSSAWKRARVQKMRAKEVKDKAMELAAVNNSFLHDPFMKGEIRLGNTGNGNTNENENVDGGRRTRTHRNRTHRNRTRRRSRK